MVYDWIEGICKVLIFWHWSWLSAAENYLRSRTSAQFLKAWTNYFKSLYLISPCYFGYMLYWMYLQVWLLLPLVTLLTCSYTTCNVLSQSSLECGYKNFVPVAMILFELVCSLLKLAKMSYRAKSMNGMGDRNIYTTAIHACGSYLS